MSDILQQLAVTLQERKQAASPQGSYVAQLHSKGLNKILEKVGEEAVETILAAKDVQVLGRTDEVISETADLWFHTLVMLSHLGISHQEVLNELAQRMGISGLDEKANRSK